MLALGHDAQATAILGLDVNDVFERTSAYDPDIGTPGEHFVDHFCLIVPEETDFAEERFRVLSVVGNLLHARKKSSEALRHIGGKPKTPHCFKRENVGALARNDENGSFRFVRIRYMRPHHACDVANALVQHAPVQACA